MVRQEKVREVPTVLVERTLDLSVSDGAMAKAIQWSRGARDYVFSIRDGHQLD